LSRLTFMYRVSQLGIEAAEARRGVLNRVVITLVKTRIANASQVTHITDLVTEQVGRTTGDLERAVKTAQLHGTEFFAAQTHEGIAGVETVAITTIGVVDFLLDLEECLQIRVDLMIALETQARRFAGDVGFGIISSVVQEIG